MLEILALGSNGNYQLGLAHNKDVSIPEKVVIDSNSPVIQIASGGNHTIFVTKDGQLLGCGNNSNGQLGHSSSKVIKTPKKLDLNKDLNVKYKLAAAGWEFSILVTDDNRIYSCGVGSKGELGIDLDKESHPSVGHLNHIIDLPSDSAVIQIAAGLNHVVVLLDNNTVWGWGSSRKGQLGSKNVDDRICFRPVLIYDLKLTNDNNEDRITHISCGREFTVLEFANRNRIEVLGTDKWGLKSHFDLSESDKFQFKTSDSGWSTIHCLSNDGKNVMSWGNNSHFQHSPASFPIDLEFAEIKAGTEHTVGIDKSHKNVFAWGWGEHGNCGPDGFEDNGNLYRIYSMPSYDARIITTVFCGHASTWIIVE